MFLKKSSVEDLIKMRYKDSEKIIEYINSINASQKNELEYAMASTI
jgi:hypothetical protein